MLRSVFSDRNEVVQELEQSLFDSLPVESTQKIMLQITSIIENWIKCEEGLKKIRAIEAYLELEKHKELVREIRVCYSAKSYKNGWNTESDIDKSRVVWPIPVLGDPDLPEIFPQYPAEKFITKETPIGSAGSCFASEIAKWLSGKDYNYIVTETDGDSLGENCSGVASALWGLMYNISSFRMLVEKSLLGREVPKIFWSIRKNDQKVILDPFREDISFFSQEAFEEDYYRHRKAAKEALTKAKVFILTFGMNEVWYLKNTDIPFSRCPWRISSSLVEKKVLTLEENLQELEKCVQYGSSSIQI